MQDSFLSAKPLDAPIEIKPQRFDGFRREGFTVVEWGGTIANGIGSRSGEERKNSKSGSLKNR